MGNVFNAENENNNHILSRARKIHITIINYTDAVICLTEI